MLEKQKIAFIGSGMMAEAMIAGLLREQLAAPQNLLAAGPRPERGEELKERYGIQPFTVNAQPASQASVVVLAVKPQQLDRVMADLHGQIKKDALVLSIIAGAPINKIAAGLAHTNIIRSMPNSPAQIGSGITVWTAADGVTPEQRALAEQILGALGEQIFMEDESYLDKATALSGTGPAYVYLFMEAMVDAGVHLGFPRRIAEQLVVKTVSGSVAYYSHPDSESHLSRLRNNVTSPGGTSAEALYYLEKAGFRTAISRAIWAAYERSLELGEGGKGHSPSE